MKKEKGGCTGDKKVLELNLEKDSVKCVICDRSEFDFKNIKEMMMTTMRCCCWIKLCLVMLCFSFFFCVGEGGWKAKVRLNIETGGQQGEWRENHGCEKREKEMQYLRDGDRFGFFLVVDVER